MFRFLLVILILLGMLGTALADSRVPLEMPFDRSNGRGVVSPEHPFVCPDVHAKAPVNLYFEGRYSQDDPQRAKIDPEAEARYREMTLPMSRYGNDLIVLANRYWLTGEKEVSVAQCTLDWLYHWARYGALTGDDNNMGRVIRHWTLGTLAIAYGQIKSEPSLNLRKRRIVEKWLKLLAMRVIESYPEHTDVKSKLNNHLYWASWSVVASGLALNERFLFEWGIGRIHDVLKYEIQGDGTLPLELNRGPKALHYHQFAIMPMVLIAEAGLRNGVDLYSIRNGILHRMVKRVLAGFEDPSYFEALTGERQDTVRTLNGGHLAWVEVYFSRFDYHPIRQWIRQYRPMFSRRIGGDISALYGR